MYCSRESETIGIIFECLGNEGENMYNEERRDWSWEHEKMCLVVRFSS